MWLPVGVVVPHIFPLLIQLTTVPFVMSAPSQNSSKYCRGLIILMVDPLTGSEEIDE